jgi:hypothetical protein
MDSLFYIALLVFISGYVYFGYKCMTFAVSRTAFLLGMFIFPFGGCIGTYWAIKDFFIFRNLSTRTEMADEVKDEIKLEGQHVISKISEDDAYLKALDEIETGNIERSIYARALAESDGKEEMVKARYIKLRVEKFNQT